MYTKIFEELSKAKNSGNKNSIRSSLLFLVSEIKNILDSKEEIKIKALPFSDFIRDSKFLFAVDNINIISNTKSDLIVSTNGLIEELLNIYGVSNSKEISDNLKNMIFSVHSSLSRGIYENKKVNEELNNSLNQIVISLQ